MWPWSPLNNDLFLSTLSLRRATSAIENQYSAEENFYPRSPCGERPIFAVRPYDAPIFLSTLSLRRATDDILAGVNELLISIHALLAESDLTIMLYDTSSLIFLSTLSLRRATTWQRGSRITYVISIHALLAESDEQY